jgi:formamidopyrimidine-DNA glycosylase
MPELPEVETVRLDLDQAIVGRTIESVILGRLRSVRRYAEPNQFVDELVGARITGTGRLGKYLFIMLSGPTGATSPMGPTGPTGPTGPGAFSGVPALAGPAESKLTDGVEGSGGENSCGAFGESVLVIHLRMSGQLLLPVGGAGAEIAKHTHVRIGLDDGNELRFVDPRTFGEMYVTSSDVPELAHLGPDAWTALSSGAELRKRTKGRSVALKATLLDQTVTAGIGSIYADEISHRAAIRPTRSVARLTGKDFDRLYLATREVLGEAIEARGSTLGDGQYVGLDGTAGTFATAHRVHARLKLGCGTCGGEISTGIVAQRSAYWCRNCQK